MQHALSDFKARAIDGRDVPLGDFAGRVLLVVNTASRCGFTPQYAALEKLQRRYGPRGFSVLGFPCNQFGNQEPGDEEAIRRFCRTRFETTFPLFAPIEVNGEKAHPFYRWLKREAPGLMWTEGIKWNFTKFLLDRAGRVRGRYAPTTRPEDLTREIESLL